MKTWNPDLDVIQRIETMFCEGGGSLGEYFQPSFESEPIQGFYEALLQEKEDRFKDIADYLKRNFDLTKPFADKPYSCNEVLEQMKEGTPLGVITYVVLGAFAGHHFL